jgi:hypothetical protein
MFSGTYLLDKLVIGITGIVVSGLFESFAKVFTEGATRLLFLGIGLIHQFRA